MQLLSFSDLKGFGISYSKVSLWRLERNGQFPRRVRIGASRHAWLQEEIEQWVGDKVRGRDEPRPPAGRRRRRAAVAAAAAGATEPSTT